MAQDSDQASSLGPITEERLRQAFSDRALISLDAAGKLLGIDVKALREMAMDGAIRTVVVGRKTRRFTEAHNQIVPERGLSARTASSSETTAVSGVKKLTPFSEMPRLTPKKRR